MKILYQRGRWKVTATILDECVPLDKLRPETCPCCGIIPKKWGFHHWIYAYTVKQVREKPYLVFDNGDWMCYACHKIANYWRNIIQATKKFPGRSLGVFKKVPLEMKKYLACYFVEMIT